MSQISFIFDCSTESLPDVSETHPFGPASSGFNSDLGIRLGNPTGTPILSISMGRLFRDGNNLILQPFSVTRRGGDSELIEEIFSQPLAFYYKNVSINEELLREHISMIASRSRVETSTIWDEMNEQWNNGTESIGVEADEVIGRALGSSMGFEVFYISNSIMENMQGDRSGLDIIRSLHSNIKTRRLDPIFFFSSIPDDERLNYRKRSSDIENAIFNRFTKRLLIEIRDEYDDFFNGNITIGGVEQVFNEANHGMIVKDEVSIGGTPSPVSYNFEHPSHRFTRLPSGFDCVRRSGRRNVKAPYHHAIQMICMDDSEHEKNWFTRNTLSWFTEENQLEYLIDGRATFRKMVEELKKIDGPEHYVRLSGWWLQTDFNLVQNETIESIFSRIDDAGASINVLIWENQISTLTFRQCQRAVSFTNRLSNGRGILDNNDSHFHGSQHQKIMVIKNREGIVGFCGGVDINTDRLDDPSHRNPSNSENPYHDTHAMIKGPAVREIDLTIVHRWNSHVQWFSHEISRDSNLRVDPATRRVMRREPHTGGFTAPYRVRVHYTDYNYDPGPRISVSNQSEYLSTSRRATAFVQVTRTFAQSHARRFYPFQPNGEVGTLNALKKAISRANIYIYIEDQFLYPYGGDLPSDINDTTARQALANDDVGILRALYQKLSANPDIVVILLTSGPDKYSQGGGTGRTMERMRFFVRMLRHSRRSLSSDKIVFCYSRHVGRQVFVHSKFWIIDDVYLKIGSANCGRRSLTHDSETDIHVVDGALLNGHRRYARSYRKALWKEHLGIHNRENLDDLDYSLSLWFNLASLPEANVAVYTSTPIGVRAVPWDVIDPEGRTSPPTNPPIIPPDSSYD